MSFSVGLTGGIGSGKSTVATLFQHLGVTIIDADTIAHSITTPGKYCYESIVEHFGHQVVKSDGTLNRKALRDIVFQNPDERKWLENRLHPVIREAIKEQLATVNTVYALVVIPLLVESNVKHYKYLNRICVIDTPETLQIQRVMDRDQCTEEAVKAILASQCSNEERLKIADDIIVNDGDLEKLRDQVAALNQQYLEIASQK